MKALLLIVILTGVAACSSKHKAPDTHQQTHVSSETLPLFEGLGEYQHPISTKSLEAQKYFNQGLILAYAFNHLQSRNSFIEAAKRDPDCAMCHWGAALALGPNINAPMSPDAEKEALVHLQMAKEKAAGATQIEKDYIAALEKRYAEPVGEMRAERDAAYAKAMSALAKKYPQDADASTLSAEALMDQHPWQYWEKSGKAKPWTSKITGALEKTIKSHPNHPGAHHLYIHAVEASPNPERAVASADKLKSLIPAAGHLVHMPAHIYIRVGRYQDAIDANLAAIKADQHHVAQAPGIYNMMYKPHNHHFLWAAATLDGQRDLATKAAADGADYVRKHKGKGSAGEAMDPAMARMMLQFEMSPLLNEVRFGRWQAVLKHEEPRSGDPHYQRGLTHYARAIALVKTGKVAEAEKELKAFESLRAEPEIKGQMVFNNSVSNLLEIAYRIAKAEEQAANGDTKAAVDHLKRAIVIEDTLTYNEPPDWHHPVRQVLGRVYLQAKQPQLAAQVYREDLKLFPRNVWSTTGLVQAHEMQGQQERANEIRRQLSRLEDKTIPASAF